MIKIQVEIDCNIIHERCIKFMCSWSKLHTFLSLLLGSITLLILCFEWSVSIYAQWKIFLELVSNPSMIEMFPAFTIHSQSTNISLTRIHFLLEVKADLLSCIQNCYWCHIGILINGKRFAIGKSSFLVLAWYEDLDPFKFH